MAAKPLYTHGRSGKCVGCGKGTRFALVGQDVNDPDTYLVRTPMCRPCRDARACRVAYADLSEDGLVNMSIGIFRGTGKHRVLLATVPLATWSSALADRSRRSRKPSMNCLLRDNLDSVARAHLIAAALSK